MAIEKKVMTGPVVSGTSGPQALAQAGAVQAKKKATPIASSGLQASYNDYTKNAGTNKAITGMYDSRKKAQLTAQDTAYNQNLSEAQAAKERIGETYQAGANDLSTQYERNRRNLNMQAAGNGINTGTGSQQQLALQSTYNRDFGKLRGQEASDLAEADRGIQNLTERHNAERIATEADLDAQRDAALISDYNNWYSRQASEYDREYNRRQTDLQRQYQNAQTLASYGDFSGYKGIYSDKQIKQMEKTWIASNPLMAYNVGKIDAKTYKKMTGKDVPGAPTGTAAVYGGVPRQAPPPAENGSLFEQAWDAFHKGEITAYEYSQIMAAAGQQADQSNIPKDSYGPVKSDYRLDRVK